jgi:phage-related holin
MIAYLSPVFESVLACLVLILIDAYYGYRVSCKYGVKEIDSSKIRKTLRKLVEAVIGISCAHMVDASIIVSFDAHLTEIVSGVIAGTESLSILESLIELDPAGPWGRLKCILRAKGQKYSDIEFPKSKNSTNE